MLAKSRKGREEMEEVKGDADKEKAGEIKDEKHKARPRYEALFARRDMTRWMKERKKEKQM